MSFFVSVWRIGYEDGLIVFHEHALGPFRSEDRAEVVAAKANRALAVHELDAEWTATVRSLEPGSYAMRDLLADIEDEA